MEKISAILPMKGNSERVPNKNLKLFDEKPLYHAVLETLQRSKYIAEIIVNTDSLNIKEDISKYFQNVKIIDRPKSLQGDFVSMNKIIGYDLKQSKSTHFIQTHSTNPLLKSETIDKAIELYFSKLNEFDSIFSVTRLQTRLYNKEVHPVNHDPKKLIRTQDLEPLFEENSNFFIFSKESFLKSGQRIGTNPNIFEMNKLEAIDIDEPEDFELAELLYKRKPK